MKLILSILCVIIGSVAIPIQIFMIVSNEQVLMFFSVISFNATWFYNGIALFNKKG